MSKKKKKQPQTTHQNIFSRKEEEIISQEIKDPEAFKRNLPVFTSMLENSFYLRNLLFEPIQMMNLLGSIEQRMSANASLAGQSVDQRQFYESVVKNLSPMVNPDQVLETLVPLAKESKIKKDKRVLLWACADLLRAYGNQLPPHECSVVRAIVLASVEKSMKLSDTVFNFLRGKEPFQFNHQDIIDTEFQPEDFYKIHREMINLEPDFSMIIFSRAISIFNEIKRDFGLPFYYVLSYPEVMKEGQSSLIHVPGQSQNPDADLSEEERNEKRTVRLAKGFGIDSYFWSNEIISSKMTQDIKTAAFGEIQDEEQFNITINAVAYSLFYMTYWNPFLLELYGVSGEKAEKINPEDEKNYILDIKGSPNNPNFLLKYANHLYEKENYEAAGIVYCKYKLITDTLDETAQVRLDELTKKYVHLQEGLQLALEEIEEEEHKA